MTAYSVFAQMLALLIAVLGAPLLTGWINQCRAWLQNRSAPPLLLPYRMLHKLFNKDSVIAENASPLFRMAPYIVFGVMFSFPLACIGYITLRSGQFADCAKMSGLVLLAYLLVCIFISRSRVVVTADYVAVRSVFGSEQRMDFRNQAGEHVTLLDQADGVPRQVECDRPIMPRSALDLYVQTTLIFIFRILLLMLL